MRQIKTCVDVLLPPDLRAEADRLAIQENWANGDSAATTRFWRPGRLLRIRFLGGNPQLQRRVLDAASAWLHDANLDFELSSDPDAEIRISFTPGATWSYIGTDALVVPGDQATANFGWLQRSTASNTLKALVLHVFGHILGLTHEHQRPPDLSMAIDFGDPVAWPVDLSETDKEYIARHYPHEAHSSAPWPADEIMPTVDAGEHRDIPRNGGGATAHEGMSDESVGRDVSPDLLDQPSGTGAGGLISHNPPGTPTPPADPTAKSVLQPATLRLDVAVPEKAQVGRAFPIAVAVRQPSSPTLVAAGLPVVQSGEAQVVWLSEPFLRLRIEVSAPECTFDGPNSRTFRLFPQVDSPVFYFNLTPKVVGTINIVVNLYQEEDTLGSAGTNTVVSDQPVGDVAVKLESSTVASTSARSTTLDGELAAARGALAGTLAHIYFEQASIKRIVIDCGLDPSHIAFDNRADNSWSDVMREAVLQDRVEALMAIATKEYPAATDLQTAIAAYRQAIG